MEHSFLGHEIAAHELQGAHGDIGEVLSSCGLPQGDEPNVTSDSTL